MNEHLQLYHTTDEKYKGIIFDNHQKLVMTNFPVPEEIHLPGMQQELASKASFPMKVYPSTEGSLIRVFYHQNEWHLATSSRLDAYTSFWSSRESFGKQFETYVEAISGTPLDVFLCSLDPTLGYFFLLPTHGANRLGKTQDEPEPKIYLVGVQTADQQLLRGEELENRLERNLWSYFEAVQMESESELIEWVQKQPVIRYESDRILKFVSDDYLRRLNRRSNNVNVIDQYISLLRTSPEEALEFRAMYPESNLEFYSKQLGLIVGYIHKNYYNRYVKKEYTIVPKTCFEFMKACHQHYLETREKTTPEQVYKIILSQNTRKIVSLIRNFSH